MGNNINAPNIKLTVTNTFPEIVLSLILDFLITDIDIMMLCCIDAHYLIINSIFIPNVLLYIFFEYFQSIRNIAPISNHHINWTWVTNPLW